MEEDDLLDNKKYHLKYKLLVDNNNGNGFTLREVMNEASVDEDVGACDALMFISISKPENCEGRFSITWFSETIEDKKKCNISNTDLFKVWSLLSAQVAERAELDWQKKVAQDALFEVRKHIAHPREDHSELSVFIDRIH